MHSVHGIWAPILIVHSYILPPWPPPCMLTSLVSWGQRSTYETVHSYIHPLRTHEVVESSTTSPISVRDPTFTSTSSSSEVGECEVCVCVAAQVLLFHLYISSAQSSSISVAPSVASPPIYHATSSSPSPAVPTPTPTPSGPQGVRAHILTYTCIYECIVLVAYSSSLCWCVLSNLRTLLYTWLCITSLNVLYSKCVTSVSYIRMYGSVYSAVNIDPSVELTVEEGDNVTVHSLELERCWSPPTAPHSHG